MPFLYHDKRPQAKDFFKLKRMQELHPSARRVRQAAVAAGLDVEIRQLAASARTAEEAASALGVSVAQIVKSLVFTTGQEPVLVCASGVNRVSLDKVSNLVGSCVRRATADEVKLLTGYAIGGVPPLGHRTKLRVLLDLDLEQWERLYAAAGTPNAVFGLTPAELVRITGGKFTDIKA